MFTDQDITEHDQRYLPGMENRAIRYYYYLNSGLNVLNQFRNLFLGIIAIYLALKLDNYWLLIGMFVPSVVLLTVAGWYNVHRLSKVTEWLGIRFSTHFGKKQFDNIQRQTELLEEIKELLQK